MNRRCRRRRRAPDNSGVGRVPGRVHRANSMTARQGTCPVTEQPMPIAGSWSAIRTATRYRLRSRCTLQLPVRPSRAARVGSPHECAYRRLRRSAVSCPFRFVEVAGRRRVRVDHDRFAAPGTPDQVGELRELRIGDLADEHATSRAARPSWMHHDRTQRRARDRATTEPPAQSSCLRPSSCARTRPQPGAGPTAGFRRGLRRVAPAAHTRDVHGRRLLHHASARFDEVIAVGLELPEVEAATKYDGTPVLRLRGCFLAGLASHPSAEPDTLIVRYEYGRARVAPRGTLG